MKRLLIILACSLASIWGFSSLQADDANQKDIEIQARGPVHEAFAQPYQANPSPSQAIDKAPPDPIPEEPAAEKPAGKNVQWIPGYWQWDNDKKDFIWVSGMWRDIPQGRRWVVGYWAKAEDGYRWVSGHFANANEQDHQYVPEPPPDNPDQGPVSAPPDDSSSYIPGAWFYGDNGYAYRDGYWTQAYDNQVWVPSYYNWTPYGYELCSGYWDYPLVDRGLLFAPAYFYRPLWYTPGWFYRPWYAIGYGGLYDNFFVGLGYHHYYFGDYYGRSYLGHGIYPWFWNSRYHYDPIWAHQRWMHRGDSHWAGGFRSNYVGRVNGTMGLPPRTLSAQSSLVATGRLPGSQRMIQPLSDVRHGGARLQPVSRQQQVAQLQSARSMINQARNLSRSAPMVSVSPRTTGFNRGGFNATSRVTGAVEHLPSGFSNRSFNSAALNRQGSPRITTGSTANRSFGSPGIHSGSPSTANRSFSQPSIRYGSSSGTNRSYGAPSIQYGSHSAASRSYSSPSIHYGSARSFTPSHEFAPRSFAPSSGRSFGTPAPRSFSPSMGGGSFHGSGGFGGGSHSSGGSFGGSSHGGGSVHSSGGGGHGGGSHRR